jgi:predicted  nucleic acid-binding Zn-ribbon protein
MAGNILTSSINSTITPPPPTQEQINQVLTDDSLLTTQGAALKERIRVLNGEINTLTNQITGPDTEAITTDQTTMNNAKTELDKLTGILTNFRRTDTTGYNALLLLRDNAIRDISTCIASCKNKDIENFGIDGNGGKKKQLENLYEQVRSINSEKSKYEESTLRKRGQKTLNDFEINDLSDNLHKLQVRFDELTRQQNSVKLTIEQLNGRIKILNEQIEDLIEKDYTNKVYNSQNLLNLNKDIDSSLNYLFSYLKKERLSSDVIYDKIVYREIEHEYLHKRNKIFDILYYCFYFSFLLIMICTENIKREHFLIYLLVGLIPFIYPFLFKFILILIKYLSNDPHGPKNAFVDINNTLVAYND